MGRVEVVGEVEKTIREWLLEKINEERKKDVGEEADAMGRAVGGGKMVKIREVAGGGVLERIGLRPVVVRVEGVRKIVSSTVSVDSNKKGAIRVKLEVPNALSRYVGVNMAVVEGGVGLVKSSVVFGEVDRTKRKNEDPVVYRWKIESEAERSRKKIGVLRCMQGFNAPTRVVLGAEMNITEKSAEITGRIEKKIVEDEKRESCSIAVGKECGREGSEDRDGVYLKGGWYHQRVREILNVPEKKIEEIMKKIGVTEKIFDFRVCADARVQIEGKSSIGFGKSSAASAHLSESASGTWMVTLRSAVKNFGLFAGLTGTHSKEENAYRNSVSPVLGAIYLPKKNWIDTVDLIWNLKEVAGKTDILSKLGAVSICVTNCW